MSNDSSASSLWLYATKKLAPADAISLAVVEWRHVSCLGRVFPPKELCRLLHNTRSEQYFELIMRELRSIMVFTRKQNMLLTMAGQYIARSMTEATNPRPAGETDTAKFIVRVETTIAHLAWM